MNIIKHKAGLASSIPNSTIHHYQIYGLRTIEDIQTQQHISIINQLLNHPLFSISSFKIRLQQLQNSAATNKSILSLYPKTFSDIEAHTTTAMILNTCYLNNITFNNSANPWPKPLSTMGTSINLILNSMPLACKIKNKLNNLHLYYIEQLVLKDQMITRTWRNLAHTIQKIPRGRQPKWFNELIATTRNWLQQNRSRLVNPNPYILHEAHLEKKK